MFDYQPLLTDGTISLRPLRAGDRDALFAAASDPAIWADHPARDRWQEAPFDGYFAACLASGKALVVEDAVTPAVLGLSRYDHDRAEPGEIEIGWTFLVRRCWGGSINSRVKRLMVGHALDGFNRVIFVVGQDNVRSRRALEKIGAAPLARILDIPIEGQCVRHVVYAISDLGALGPRDRQSLPEASNATDIAAEHER